MNNEPYIVTKHSIALYKLRHPTGLYWADISIDAGYHQGRITIISDFGNYSHYWGACGQDFKTFLADLHIDYVASKFGVSRWFDAPATLTAFSRRIQETAELQTKPALLSELNKLQPEQSASSFKAELQRCPLLLGLFKGQPELVYTLEASFIHLWQQIWPVMLDAFKKEREATSG